MIGPTRAQMSRVGLVFYSSPLSFDPILRNRDIRTKPETDRPKFLPSCVLSTNEEQKKRKRKRERDRCYEPGGSLERRCLLASNPTTKTPAMTTSSPTATDNSTAGCVFCRNTRTASMDYLPPLPTVLSALSIPFFII